jgi:hypothetical protein
MLNSTRTEGNISVRSKTGYAKVTISTGKSISSKKFSDERRAYTL